MTDTRHKNAVWLLHGTTHVDVTIAILMDLRDELQAIRRLMECPNVSAGFRAMQSVNRRLARGIVTRRPKAKRAKR